MAACFNIHGNHGSRDDGSNTIPRGTVFGKTYNSTYIKTIDKRTNPSLIDALICGSGLWFKRSVTDITHRLFFKIGFIEMYFSPATSIRPKLSNRSATIQRRIGLSIETLSNIFTRLCVDSRPARNPPITMVRKNQPRRLNVNADLGCSRLFSQITFSHRASQVLFATPFFLAK